MSHSDVILMSHHLYDGNVEWLVVWSDDLTNWFCWTVASVWLSVFWLVQIFSTYAFTYCVGGKWEFLNQDCDNGDGGISGDAVPGDNCHA